MTLTGIVLVLREAEMVMSTMCSCLASFKSHLHDAADQLQKDQHVESRVAAGQNQRSPVTGWCCYYLYLKISFIK